MLLIFNDGDVNMMVFIKNFFNIYYDEICNFIIMIIYFTCIFYKAFVLNPEYSKNIILGSFLTVFFISMVKEYLNDQEESELFNWRNKYE